jgi:low temperature requirement protein LtrA
VLDALLAVATAAALWWSYFGRALGWLEQGLHAQHGSRQSRMARDAFSFIHVPLVVGVIFYAAAIEAILSHPGDPLALDMRLLLGAGMLLFSGAAALAVWRAGCRLLWPRLVLTATAAAAVAAIGTVPPAVPLAVMLLGMAARAVVEQVWDPNPNRA